MRVLSVAVLSLLLPGLLAVALPAAGSAAPADAARPLVVVDPRDAPRGVPLSVPWLHVENEVLHDGKARIRLHGAKVRGTAVEIRSAGDGYVMLSRTLNRAFLYRVDASGVVARLVGDRETDGEFFVDSDGERVAYATYDDDGATVTVRRIADGEELARHTAQALTLLDFRDGEVWLSTRPEFEAPYQLVTWRPESDTTTVQHPGRFDGLSPRHDAAWRFTGLRKLRMVPLGEDAGWEPWTVRAHIGSTVSFSPDGRRLVTYTRFRPRRDRYPHRGQLVVRDPSTGEATRKFRGWMYGDSFWETDRRLVGQAYDGDSFRVAQLRMTLGGRVTRVSRFARLEVPRAIVDAGALALAG